MAFKEGILQNSIHRVWSRKNQKTRKRKEGVQLAGFMNRWSSFRQIWWKGPRWLHGLLGNAEFSGLPCSHQVAVLHHSDKASLRPREVSVFEHRLHFCLERKILCVYLFWLESAFSLGWGKKKKILISSQERQEELYLWLCGWVVLKSIYKCFGIPSIMWLSLCPNPLNMGRPLWLTWWIGWKRVRLCGFQA